MTQQNQSNSASKRSRLPALTAKRALVLILGVLALVFIFQNTDQASVNLFAWEVTAPGWVWLLGLFVVGVAVGSVFPWLRRKG